ncbi:MAG: MBL fold metallo-hydrolase [Candidatus Riflebacteria bacterium]|nr:MBL fold metallo-hydrolase [Candidatus Riflebacteria bacterium]
MLHRIAQLAVLMLLLAFIATPAYANEAPLLRVTFLDVHQGDCILIRSAEKTIMIDAGDDNRNAAQRYIIPFLKKAGIKHIDQAFITHPHRDHFGGFIDLVKDFSFGEFVYSNDSEVSSEPQRDFPDPERGSQDGILYAQLKDMILEKKIPYRRAKTGELLNWGKGVKAQILYTDDGREEDKAPGDDKTNPNEMSIIIKATVGEVSYLFTGDAEKNAENKLLASTPASELKTTVLKSGHHGSKTSSTHAFMDVIKPEYGVISAGKGNSFGHPTQAVLDIYDYHKMKVFRTDTDGHVESFTDGKTVKFVTDNSLIAFDQLPKVIALTANSATIQWSTNKPGTTAVFYGTTKLNQSKEYDHAVKVHTVTITGLKPSTDYKYSIESRDPREVDKVVTYEGTITTPAGAENPLPKIVSIGANYDKLYMKHPFKVLVPVTNPAEIDAAGITLEVYHSAMCDSNLIDKVKFAKLGASETVQAVMQTQIDWLGEVELIAVLKKGTTIIDTASIIVILDAKVMYVDAAHGNKDFFTGRFAGMKMDLFQNYGIQMRSISKEITFAMIEDAFVIAIPHPTLDFKKVEVTALKKFVAAGGSLIMYGKSDFRNLSNPDMLNSILKGVGSKIRFNDDQACDPTDNIGPPYRPFAKNFPTPDITGNVQKLLLRDSCTLINSNPQNKGLVASKNLFLLATGDEDSYNSDADELGDSYIYASHTPLLPIPLSAAEDLGLGRVACISEGLYQDSFYSSTGDLNTPTFNRNIIHWLSLGKEKTIRELLEYVADLDQEEDAEVRSERYERLSKTILKQVRSEFDGDNAALLNMNELLSEYDGSTTIDSLKLQVEQLRRFDSLHTDN